MACNGRALPLPLISQQMQIFTIRKFNLLVYSKSNCCCSATLTLLIISVDFDVDLFRRLLFSFTYFVEPNGCVRL
jgi:hypothetical protein